MEYKSGDWVRVTKGDFAGQVRRVKAEIAADEITGERRLLLDPADDGGCYLDAYARTVEPWLPRPGERVRRVSGRHVPPGWSEEFVVDYMGINMDNEPLVMRAGETFGYQIHDIAPVLTPTGLPVVEETKSEAKREEHAWRAGDLAEVTEEPGTGQRFVVTAYCPDNVDGEVLGWHDTGARAKWACSPVRPDAVGQRVRCANGREGVTRERDTSGTWLVDSERVSRWEPTETLVRIAPTAAESRTPPPGPAPAPPPSPLCGSPWHGHGCRCATGWLRAELEPERVEERWETRRHGRAVTSGRVGVDPMPPGAERYWTALGPTPSGYCAADHPTRDGAIAAWRAMQ